MQYSEKLFEYFHMTPHAILQEEPVHMYCVEVGHIDNSDVFKLFLQIENNLILKAGFKAHGSPVLIAMAEYLCCWVENKSIDEVIQVQHEDLLKELGLTNLHVHIAALILSAMREIIKNYVEETINI